MRRWVALIAVAAALAALSMLVGDGDLSDAAVRDTILALRAWRTLSALIVGAGLGVAGLLVQSLFHNPLASPDILGTTAGATLGGQLALLAGVWLGWGGELVVPLGGLAGALVALAAIAAVARRHDPLTVVLTGVLLASLSVSVGGLVTSVAMESWQLGRAVLAFTLGGLDGVGVRRVTLAAPWLMMGLGACFQLAPALDVLTAGDDEAAAYGVDVPTVRRWGIVWTAVLAAAANAVGGQVAFVGLLVPHGARRWISGGHRTLIPATALFGAAFVTASDVAVRLVPARGDVPLGVVTGLVGAPLFFTLLMGLRDDARRA